MKTFKQFVDSQFPKFNVDQEKLDKEYGRIRKPRIDREQETSKDQYLLDVFDKLVIAVRDVDSQAAIALTDLSSDYGLAFLNSIDLPNVRNVISHAIGLLNPMKAKEFYCLLR